MTVPIEPSGLYPQNGWRPCVEMSARFVAPSTSPGPEPGCECGTTWSAGKFLGIDGDPACPVHGDKTDARELDG